MIYSGISILMSSIKHLAYALSDAFCSGSLQLPAMQARGSRVLGHSPLWLAELCECLVAQKDLLKNPQQLKYYIQTFPALVQASQQGEIKGPLSHYYLPPKQMQPIPKYIVESIPVLHNYQDLLKFFELTEKQLHWLSKPWLNSHTIEAFPLQNYLYRWQVKSGSEQFRLLEVPKYRLKLLQRKIALDILNEIPLHASAHGFRKGHSITSCAQIHQNKRWVLKMDLKNFFVSITYARVFGIFNALGYSKNIAKNLSLLTTCASPETVLKQRLQDWRQRQIYHVAHLPQGAPSSPVLSNLAAYTLDCRLSSLAKSIQADYSRYADDLFFSGNSYQDFSQLIPLIASIAGEESFQINYRKTRVMGAGQRQKITGIVVNKHSNLSRKEYDQLKAVLYNCVKYGVLSQAKDHPNFYAHLKGKIAYVKMLNVNKAKKLEWLFSQINWQGQ